MKRNNATQNSNYPFIIFEGVDGGGKTTHAKILSKQLSGLYIKNPPRELSQSVHLLNKAPIDMRALFYLTGNCMVDKIAQKECENRPVIADRHIYSTMSYYDGHLLNLPKLSKPDMIFYLRADWEVIDERLAKRPIRKPHESLENLMRVDAIYTKHLENKTNVMYIDTTINSIEQTAGLIRSQFEKQPVLYTNT